MSTVSRETLSIDREEFADGFGQRFRTAWHALEESEGGGRISAREMGERVGAITGEVRTANTVLDWRKGKSVPDALSLAGIGTVVSRDPGWLTFGKLSSATGEPLEPSEEDVLPRFIRPEAMKDTTK